MAEHVPLRTKIAFGVGDVYGGGSFNIINFLYAFYLANVLGIPTAWAAAIMMVARLWDAVSDPLMGFITDNTRTRLGRRKPYFIAGIPLIVVSMVWVWYPLAAESTALRVLFAASGYIFYNTVTTLVMVPYMSMAAEISLDYYERNSINTVRMMFSLGSSLMCALLPLAIVEYVSARTGSYASGYLAMAVVIGLVFALPYIAVVLGTRERADFSAAPPREDWWTPMLNAFKVRSFRMLIVVYLAVFVSLDLITTSFQFYMTYVLRRPDEFASVLGVLIVVEIIAALFTAPLVRLTNKAAATMLGSALWMITGLATLLIGPDSPGFAVYLVAAAMGVAMAFPVVLLNSLFADVSDVGELYFGSRVEGTFSGVQTFVRKVASAGANASFMLAIGWAGFVAPVRRVEGLRETLSFQAQPESFVWAVRLTIALAPLLLLGLGIAVMLRWPITSERHAKLLDYLAATREGRDCDPGLRDEVLGLRDTAL
ncbi:MAG: MFS transporter [Spirochaetaceae bacterium]|nr:MFS transporter [Spirochaetaceae bacterium]HPE90152.1 MFS transporter [Spirochaetales bacterium]